MMKFNQATTLESDSKKFGEALWLISLHIHRNNWVKETVKGVFDFYKFVVFFSYFSIEFISKSNECGLIVGFGWFYSLSRFTERITTPWNVSNKEIDMEMRTDKRFLGILLVVLNPCVVRPLSFSWFIFYLLIHLWDSKNHYQWKIFEMSRIIENSLKISWRFYENTVIAEINQKLIYSTWTGRNLSCIVAKKALSLCYSICVT